MKLTKTLVDHTPTPTGRDQEFLRDTVLQGFALRITARGVKSFIVEKRIKGRNVRKTLGQYPALTVEEARIEAQKFLGEVAKGLDPIVEKRVEEARSVTLRQVKEEYLAVRKGLRPKTIGDYEHVVTRDFADWCERPLISITKDAVAKRHMRLGQRSPSRANTAMRILRALFRFARGQYEDAEGRSLFPENPVDRLNHTRAWFPNKRRKTVIKRSQLADWYRSVMSLKDDERGSQSDTVADFLTLLLFTGLRKTEALTLTWQAIDFRDRTLSIQDTKNHEPLTLPLSDFIIDLLQARAADSQSLFVFPGTGEHGHLIEPRKQMNKITERSGVPFCLHDLRRTFITVAESLDIPVYAIKHLVNHKMNHDVTAGYVVMDVERLRVPMQRISDYLEKTVKDEERPRILYLETHRTSTR